MQAIWKFPIDPTTSEKFAMPAGANILCVQVQHGMPCVWALVPDIDAKPTVRTIRTYGTGHPHEAISGRYIGTYQLDGGALVFHVFEE